MITGLLLAAGAGSRMGAPKALMHSPAGESWLQRSVEVLLSGGCDEVVVVLGAGAEAARTLVPATAQVVIAGNWASGQSASLRAGLAALTQCGSTTALVHLVDLPDIGADVVARTLSRGLAAESPARALARATFDGRPGHPVLIGADHWPTLLTTLSGDHGARDHLAQHHALAIECGDLATGRDVDGPTGGSSHA